MAQIEWVQVNLLVDLSCWWVHVLTTCLLYIQDKQNISVL